MSSAGSIAAATAVLAVMLTACLGSDGRSSAQSDPSSSAVEWPNYANDPGGTKYSPLTQIDRRNVASLRVAWSARARDFPATMFQPRVHGQDEGLTADPRSGGSCSACSTA